MIQNPEASVEVRRLRGADTRVETGVTQFGYDWPGVFIRGDSAFGYSYALKHILQQLEKHRTTPTDVSDVLYVGVVKELIELLTSSDVAVNKAVVHD